MRNEEVGMKNKNRPAADGEAPAWQAKTAALLHGDAVDVALNNVLRDGGDRAVRR